MRTIKKILSAGLIILILNLIWEFSHHSLYIDLSGIPKYTHLIIASIVDMLIILGIFAIISLKNKNREWIKSPNISDYLLISLMGIAVAFFIEIINLDLGRWKYTTAMPTFFEVGITPLIQLALTGITSLIILKNSEKNSII